jgi:hypothetical protein
VRSQVIKLILPLSGIISDVLKRRHEPIDGEVLARHDLSALYASWVAAAKMDEMLELMARIGHDLGIREDQPKKALAVCPSGAGKSDLGPPSPRHPSPAPSGPNTHRPEAAQVVGACL